MNMIDQRIVPKRIRQARVSRGLSMAEMAELLGLSKQAISQYELGTNEPSKSVLNEISRLLKYPVSRFYKPMPVKNEASSMVFFRCKQTTRVKDKEAAKEKIDIFEEITQVLTQYVDFADTLLPKFQYMENGIDVADNGFIEGVAKRTRDYWGLGDQPIGNLMNVVQKNGVLVSKIVLRANKLDAFSVWRGKPYIFLSSDKNSNARTRFDIAHELGHLLMHKDSYTEYDIEQNIIAKKLEHEADRFAGAFLLPASSFSRDVFSTSIDHFVQLKKKWKVSIACMIYRCDTLGLLTSSQIKYLKDQMTKRMYWRREPLDNETIVEKPFAHKQAVELLLKHNILSPSILIEKTGCSAKELEEYCFLEKGTLSTPKSLDNVIQLKSKFQS